MFLTVFIVHRCRVVFCGYFCGFLTMFLTVFIVHRCRVLFVGLFVSFSCHFNYVFWLCISADVAEAFLWVFLWLFRVV
jgi:hypothetical protein